MSDEEYKVEKLMNHRKTKNGVEFLVKWEGFSHEENTWEVEENLDNCPDLIDAYWEEDEKVSHSQSTSKLSNFKTMPNGISKKSSNWEDTIKSIDGVRKQEGKVIVFIQWKDGSKSSHPSSLVVKKAPKKLNDFYEDLLEE